MDKGVKLEDYEDHLVTRMGAWFPGERVTFRGLDLHRDFADADWSELYFYSITGRKFNKVQLKMLNALMVYTSYPDPRLWNNRVAALAGTVRSTGTLGLGAALAVSEATAYGRGPDIRAMDFLVRMKGLKDKGEDLASLVKNELQTHRGISGYGRPITATDERVMHIMKKAQQLGLDQGSYVCLARQIEQILLKGRWRFRMNATALGAALCADMDISPRQYYLCTFIVFLAGMIPCLVEAGTNPEGTFLPLGCARIAYEGPSRRHW